MTGGYTYNTEEFILQKGIRSKKQGKFLNQDSKLTKAQNISANLIILAR